jgi:hypothetical protein
MSASNNPKLPFIEEAQNSADAATRLEILEADLQAFIKEAQGRQDAADAAVHDVELSGRSVKKTFADGDRVFWHDPDEEACSGPGTIVDVQADEDEVVFQDSIVHLKMDDGGEVECFPHELEDLSAYEAREGKVVDHQGD